jgi:hypothetical protein
LGEKTDEDVEILIQDPQGETIRTLTGSARQGLNSTSWNLRGESVPLPRSPSEVRDSIATEVRLAVVVDSLEAAGVDKEDIDEAMESLREPSQSGGFNFGGGGGGGGAVAGSSWVDRPAEGRATSGGGGGGFGGGEATLEQDILRLVRGDTGGRRRRRGGGSLFPTRSESASMAEPGSYTVILKIGDQSFSQSLQVDRSATAPAG